MLDLGCGPAPLAFMVEWTDRQLQRDEPHLDAAARAERVRHFWARPDADPANPPPHSTGAALDVTLMDERGREVDMASPFDQPPECSHPRHFASTRDEAGERAHAHRELLFKLLSAAGFRRHPHEWWHFSFGDQPGPPTPARQLRATAESTGDLRAPSRTRRHGGLAREGDGENRHVLQRVQRPGPDHATGLQRRQAHQPAEEAGHQHAG